MLRSCGLNQGSGTVHLLLLAEVEFSSMALQTSFHSYTISFLANTCSRILCSHSVDFKHTIGAFVSSLNIDKYTQMYSSRICR
jgi:hypothetical protein